jgi:hypothetical protein
MAADGWRLRMAADLQHAASLTAKALAWLPGWALAAALLVLAVFLYRQAVAHLAAPARRPPPGAAAGASPASHAAPPTSQPSCCDPEQPAPQLAPTSTGEDRPV